MKIQALAPKVYAPLLAIHALVLAAEPTSVLSWSYLLVLAVLLFTLFLAWRRLRLSVAHNRPWWTMLLLALVAQLAAFGLLLADSLVHPQGTLGKLRFCPAVEAEPSPTERNRCLSS